MEDDRGATPVWQALLDLRMALIQAGYHPIPTRDKVTWMPRWGAQPPVIDQQGQSIWARSKGWGRKNPKAPGGYDPPVKHNGTGVLLVNKLMVVDMDVQDEGVVNTIYNEVTGKYPQLLNSPIRLNTKNCKLMLFALVTEDFHARRTAKYLSPDGRDHQVELYGPRRSQRDGESCAKYVACYGPHDLEAGSVYRFEDDTDLTSCSRHALPMLTLLEVEDIANIAEEVLIGQGWEKVTRATGSDTSTMVYDLVDGAVLDTDQGPMLVEEIEASCRAGDEIRTSAALWEKGAGNTSRCIASVVNEVFGIWDTATETVHRRARTTPEGMRELFAKLPTSTLFTTPAPPARRSMATPFRLVDEASIPKRPWIYGRHYIRGFVSATVSPGGLGKSTMAMTESMAIAANMGILGTMPDAPARVWYVNLEDPREELDRRAVAIAKHHGVTPELLGDRLMMDSGREQSFNIAVGDNGASIVEPVVKAITETIISEGIDVVIIDPFVSSHSVNENDNSAIDAVVKTWAAIAEKTHCSIELIHHVRKTSPNEELTADSARGASAFLAAARSVRVLNGMTANEAGKHGIEEHWRYFRMGIGKANMAPPPDKDAWLQKESVELSNGDMVGVVSPWQIPVTIIIEPDDITALRTVLATQVWRDHQLSSDWIGLPIAEALGLDMGPSAKRDRTTRQELDRTRVMAVLAQLLASGVIIRAEVKGPDRHGHKGYVVA